MFIFLCNVNNRSGDSTCVCGWSYCIWIQFGLKADPDVLRYGRPNNMKDITFLALSTFAGLAEETIMAPNLNTPGLEYTTKFNVLEMVLPHFLLFSILFSATKRCRIHNPLLLCTQQQPRPISARDSRVSRPERWVLHKLYSVSCWLCFRLLLSHIMLDLCSLDMGFGLVSS